MIEETLKVKVIEEHNQLFHELNVSTFNGNCEWRIPESVLLIHTDVFRTIKLHKVIQGSPAASLCCIMKQGLAIDILQIDIESLFGLGI